MNRWKRKFLTWPPYKRTVYFTKHVYLPGFKGLSLYQVSRFFIEGIQKGRINTRASAICFKLLLAIPPTLIVLISFIPFVPIENFQYNLLLSISKIMPDDAFRLFDSTLVDLLNKKHETFLSISFILALFYASNSVNAMLIGFSGSYNQLETRNPFRQQILAVLILFLLSIVTITGVGLITFSGYLFSYLRETNIIGHDFIVFLLEIGKWILVVFTFMLGISVLYNAGSHRKWRLITPGAILATIGFIVVSLLFAWYVNNFGNYNKLYGTLGTLLVLMLWLFFNCVVLLLGFELNASIWRARQGLDAPAIPDND